MEQASALWTYIIGVAWNSHRSGVPYAAVIAVLYVFRTPRDKFGLLVVAIVSFILLTTAANERMRRLRIYAKWLYD